MTYTYDTGSFIKGYMMLGSKKIRTLESINGNFKKLTCSEVSANYYDTDRYYIGGIPMLTYKMFNGKAALRVVDATAINSLRGDFTSLTDKTVLNGCSVQVSSNGYNEYILNLQRLTDMPSVNINTFTDFSGIPWLLDEDNSLAVVTTTQEPIALKKFIFGSKLILCGEYSDGFSPIALIDSNPDIITSNLVINLDAADINSYPGYGSTWYDISGNDRDITLFNTPTFSNDNEGILRFTRSNFEYGESNSALPNLTNWTAEAWVKFHTVPSAGNVTTVITGEYDLISKLNFSIGTNLQPTNAKIYAGFFDGAWRNTNTGFTPVKDIWYHLVGTYDGARIKLYVDGSQNDTGNIIASPQSGGKLRIARRWDDVANNSNYFLDSTIPVVRIYNRALNATEVLKNYNAVKSRYI